MFYKINISIHKPPASIRFAPIKHTLAVTVESFKFSSRYVGVAYEMSQKEKPLHRIALESIIEAHRLVGE
jgi:hypothetical protein